MFDTFWRRRRSARARRVRDELRSRAVIRAAEELVGSAWIDHLTRRASNDPVAGQLLEWEQVTITQASRARAREAAQDQRRLADVIAQEAELTEAGGAAGAGGAADAAPHLASRPGESR